MNRILITEAQQGDHQAFIELLGLYDRQIMSICYRFSANLYDREDLYQEVFLQCFRSIKQFKFKSQFSTWLTRLALNSCIDYMNRAPELAELEETSAVEIDWEQQSKLVVIHEAIKKLAGPQRICFHMYYIEGWSVKEIMTLLNCGEGTVKTHMHRARKRIKSNTRIMQWQLNPT